MKDQIQQAAEIFIEDRRLPNPILNSGKQRLSELLAEFYLSEKPVTPPMRELKDITGEEAIRMANILYECENYEVSRYDGKILLHGMPGHVNVTLYCDDATIGIHRSKGEFEIHCTSGIYLKAYDYLRSISINIPNAYPVPVDNWIRVSDGLPDDSILGGEIVLCYNGNHQHTGYLKMGVWYKAATDTPVDVQNGWNVTHWQPLPTAPKQ